MSEREVTELLDRVAARTPPMDVEIPAVVGIGRARQRRRRVAGAGMALAGVVLAGGLWWGLGADGPLGTVPEVQPAQTTTTTDDPVPEVEKQATDEAVGEGGHITLLGEDYEVAVDDQGWPMLVEDDGSTFLVVTDEQGPSDGGIVMWREHWWPWSDRNAVHFYVGWQPPAGAEVVLQRDDAGDDEWFDPQDMATISGPEGVVTLVSIPAEDDGLNITGLGLRTEDGITPVAPG